MTDSQIFSFKEHGKITVENEEKVQKTAVSSKIQLQNSLPMHPSSPILKKRSYISLGLSKIPQLIYAKTLKDQP